MKTIMDYVSRPMIVCDFDATVLEISQTMAKHKISSIAIADKNNNRIIGILTERDIVKDIAHGVSLNDSKAGSSMSTPVFSIKSDESVEDAAYLMLDKKVRHLLVEDINCEVVGILTTTDIARYLKERMEAERGKKDTKDQTNVIDNASKREAGQKQTQSRSSDELLTEVWELFF